MKKLLLISQNFYPEIGSASNRMKQLFSYFSKKYDAKLLTTEPQYPNRSIYEQPKFWGETMDGEKISRIQPKTAKYESNMILRFLLYLETMCRFLWCIVREKESFDIVYVSSPPISIAIVGLFAKKKLNATLMVDVRDLWPASLQGVGKFNSSFFLFVAYWIEHKIYQHADHIIINSESFQTYIVEKGIDTQKISFVPNGLTNQEMAQGRRDRPMKMKQEPLTVIYTGNFGLAQELESFINMADHFKTTDTVRFEMIGYGAHYQTITNTVRAKHLRNIHIYPPDTRENILQKLIHSDIAFVSLVPHPVFETVIPGKIIDYMGCGLPIIGMVSGYAKQVIEKSETGFSFQHKEADKMYQKLSELLESPVLRKKLRNNGLAYAKKNYSWQDNFQRIEHIISKMQRRD
ncbi:glycosyltransferase family 4 protein [Listeria riparia]|uniref:Glycoside hydrolase family protein n=1 Tax=Listeria riparia FSL S10-1204 TaxID=1265816 RepID=W7DAN6_9LIST|nr:glycosyltransferase family 4 protein [Listeria riparia]EUJ42308.1 glycoside hydrolase family protein [Listeria riparia FSL S10-1204]